MANGVNNKGGYPMNVTEDNLDEVLETLHAHTAPTEELHQQHQPQFTENEINNAIQSLQSHTDSAPASESPIPESGIIVIDQHSAGLINALQSSQPNSSQILLPTNDTPPPITLFDANGQNPVAPTFDASAGEVKLSFRPSKIEGVVEITTSGENPQTYHMLREDLERLTQDRANGGFEAGFREHEGGITYHRIGNEMFGNRSENMDALLQNTAEAPAPEAHNRSEGMQDFVNSVLSDPDVQITPKGTSDNTISVISYEGGESGFRIQNQAQNGEVLGVTNNLTQQQLQEKIPALTQSQIDGMKQNDTQMVSTGASVVTMDQYRQAQTAPEATMKGGKVETPVGNPVLSVAAGEVLDISADGDEGYRVQRLNVNDPSKSPRQYEHVSAEDLQAAGFTKDDMEKLNNNDHMVFDGQQVQTMSDFAKNQQSTPVTPKNYQSGINGTAFTTYVADTNKPLEFDINKGNQLSESIFQSAAAPNPSDVKLVDAKIGIIAPEFTEASNNAQLRSAVKPS